MAIDYGVIVNPRGLDLPEALKAADCIPLKTIQELRGITYSAVGKPERVQFTGRVVGIIEVRDGAIMDVIRQLKSFEFAE